MRSRALLILIAGFLSGCGDQPDLYHQDADTGRWFKPQQVERGAKLYQSYCSACHGNAAEGAENWQQRNTDQSFRPPPLNGSGHTWHHSYADLEQVIMNGRGQGESVMPAWKELLTEQQVADVLAWIQSQWHPKLYDAWLRTNK